MSVRGMSRKRLHLWRFSFLQCGNDENFSRKMVVRVILLSSVTSKVSGCNTCTAGSSAVPAIHLYSL